MLLADHGGITAAKPGELVDVEQQALARSSRPSALIGFDLVAEPDREAALLVILRLLEGHALRGINPHEPFRLVERPQEHVPHGGDEVLGLPWRSRPLIAT